MRRLPAAALLTTTALLSALVPATAAVAAEPGVVSAAATAWDAEITWPLLDRVPTGAQIHATVHGFEVTAPTPVTLRGVTSEDQAPEDGPVLATATLTPASPTVQLSIPTSRAGTWWLYLQVGSGSSGDWDGFVNDDYAQMTVLGAASAVTATLPNRVVKTGAKVPVSGTVTGTPGRPVYLQARGTNNTWVTLTEGKTGPDGAFTLPAPTWWAADQTLRAYAPATDSDEAAASANTGLLRVRRGWKPRPGKAFTYLSPDQARWNPCQPITYRVNPARAPKGYLKEVRAGFEAVSEATGLRFTYVGATDFVPYLKGQGPWAHPSNADFVIAWANEKMVPGLRGGTIGLGGASHSDGLALSGGQVVFDTAARFGRTGKEKKNARRVLTLHEFGHAIGLHHVNDKRQLMATGSFPKAQWGNGDLRGLAALGASNGCIPGSTRYQG